jgi:23S rRNA (cytosine1962-C5)-methyltransferase
VLKTFGNPADGDVVSLKDGQDRLLGSAIYNSRSQIVARRFSRQRQDLDLEFFQRRLQQSIDYRARRGVDSRLARLVWSESDGLPGVIIDRYGDHLVLQTLTLAMDQRKALIAETLQKLLAPKSIIERNDAPIRKAEGLELHTGVLAGEAPSAFDIHVDGLVFEIDLQRGQKTGFYLDQIPNYAEVARYARGRRVLDCFANQGAFALACAKAGAAQVQAVDISTECVELVRRNAQRNQLSIEAHAANVFDLLKDLERQQARYDLIILDPPSFTKSKGNKTSALRGYHELHLRALRLLTPGGILATFSCSHHVTAQDWIELLSRAATETGFTLRLRQRLGQAADHPVLVNVPETEYLHGYVVEKVDSD